MFTRFRSLGLFLGKEDHLDSDQLFTVYTKDFGKLEVSGRAIRKVSSKLRPGAEIFYLSDIEFIQGKNRKVLTEAVPIEKSINLRKDSGRLKIAYEISEILDNLIKGQEPDKEIWQLLAETFRKLEDCENPEIIYHYFFWNFISILGYKPELYHCVVCREKIMPGKLYFSQNDGGAVCQSCFTPSKEEIQPAVIKILRIILKEDWQTLSKLKGIEGQHLKGLQSISEDYYLHICGNLS
ncbi:MAG: DNA repair protein RecO [Candidatus Wildermuthbacteria bacterium]|nr:DNA repair protein RecO [Candidatus Wildermuthbacteria bacterium]